MRRFLCLAAMGSLAFAAHATTLVVDGVGAGGNYATISAALQALGGANGTDGTADTINVTADILDNHPAILVNGTAAAIGSFGRITDDLTIDGNADANSNNCRLALAANIGAGTDLSDVNTRFAIQLAVSQKLTIKNLIIIPQTMGAAGGVVSNCAMVVGPASATAVLNGAQFTLDNCTFTASADASNTPLNTNAASSGTPTYWGGEVGGFAACLSVFNNGAGAQSFVHTISNCTFAHGGFVTTNNYPNVAVLCDSNPTGNGVVNISHCRSTRARSVNSQGHGIFISSALNTVINLDFVTCDYNQTYGLTCALNDTNASNITHVNINQGCAFSNNSYRGLSVQATASVAAKLRIKIAGTAANPVVVEGNSNRGVYFAGGGDPNQMESADHLIVRRNAIQGFEFNEFDATYPTTAGPLFTDCLFSNNGDTVIPNPSNFNVQDTNASAGGVQFNRCTFHDPNTAAGGAGYNMRNSSANFMTYSFTNCIFSGSNANDLAINHVSGTSDVYNLTNCALVGFGPDALSAAPITAGVATVNQTASITADPVYVSDVATSVGFAQVRNGSASPDGYADAAQGGAILSGGATYVGDARVKLITSVPQTATLSNGVVLAATAGTAPFEWIAIQNNVDPITVGSSGISAFRDTSKYFDISYYPTAAAATADVTLPFAAGIATPRIYHFGAGAWAQTGTFASATASTVTHSGISSFSPFSVGGTSASAVNDWAMY